MVPAHDPASERASTLRVTRRADAGAEAVFTVTLPYDLRQRSRLRTDLDEEPGAETEPREIAVILERGSCLRDGDKLLADSGEVVLVRAAEEPLSVVRSPDALALSRVAYHLGNRHVGLQIREGELAYQHDHVLDEMVRQLGLVPVFASAPFEPEPGAYGHGHSHLIRGGHSHAHLPSRSSSDAAEPENEP